MFATLMMTLMVAGPPQPVTIDGVRDLVRSGRMVEALRGIRELQRQSANDPEANFQIGELLQELAASRADRLKQVAPESAELHELLGRSLEAHQKTEEAAAEYQLAARANPNLPGIHFLIGNLYWKQRDFNAARPALEAELKLNPNHALANLRMGEMSLISDTDNPDTAISFLNKALSDSRFGLEAHRELGKAYRLAHRYPEAYKELQLVVQQRPDDEQVHGQLAALYRDEGKSADARRELEKQRELLRQKRQDTFDALQKQGDH